MEIDKNLILTIFVFLSVVTWIFFANASGFTLTQALFLENYAQTLSIVLSQNFIIAILLFPLPYVFASLSAKHVKKDTARFFCSIAALIATGICAIFFPIVLENYPFFIFYIISFIIVVETADLGYKELKRFITPRAAASATNKAKLLLAVGLFLSCVQIMTPTGPYVTSFEKALTNNISSQKFDGSDLTDISTNQLISIQKQSLESILKHQLFEKIKTKEDPDVQAFVVAMETVYQSMDSAEYKAAIREQVRTNQDTMFQSKNLSTAFTMAKQQFPQIQIFEEMLWLFEGILAVSILITISNIIFNPLSMIYSFIIDKLYPVGIED